MNPVFAYRSKLEDSSNSDSSDSEAECDVWKRSSKKPPPVNDRLPVPPDSTLASPASGNPSVKKRKVNNIWSDVVIEAEVSETLGQVGLTKMPGNADRTCESYDFTRKHLDNRPFPEEEQRMDSGDFSNKRRMTKSSFRHRVHFNKHVSSTARKICWKLGEPKKDLIGRVVDVIGSQKAIELLKMTEDVEEAGGMLVKNGQRRRSPGGVYLQLVKSDSSITKEDMEKIFQGDDEFITHIKRIKEKKKKLKKLKLFKEKKKLNKVKNDAHMDTSEMTVTSATNLLTKENDSKSAESSPNSTTTSEDLKHEDLKESTASSNTVHAEVEMGCEDLDKTSDIEDGEILD